MSELRCRDITFAETEDLPRDWEPDGPSAPRPLSRAAQHRAAELIADVETGVAELAAAALDAQPDVPVARRYQDVRHLIRDGLAGLLEELGYDAVEVRRG